jgi:dihydrofolate synthase / folylpolyglutamate synthase
MATDTYADVLVSLYRLEAAKGMDFKLERVALALKNLGNPHTRFAAVHIAGTNGKGSVAAMLHAIWSAGGYRVGLYTSPHLVSFTERIRVAEQEISQEAVVMLTHEIHAAATVRGIELTFFEFVTVMAFLHFARCGVDIAVVEVGLGGRLDATNVLLPEVSIITTIGLDHQEFLGDTLQAVAREKGGIIKPGRPVIAGHIAPPAAEVLRDIAAEQHAPAYWAGTDFAISHGASLRFHGGGWDIDGIELSLRGRYQCDNAAVALQATALLRAHRPMTLEAVRRGLANVRWPGRLDIVHDAPLTILDGAHNEDGMEGLLRELPAIVGARRIHFLFGVMRDKHWHPMVAAIASRAASVVATTVLPPRGEAPEILARAFTPYCPVTVAADPTRGLEILLQSAAQRSDAVVVTGSLFLVGAVYPYFLQRSGRRGLFSAPPVPVQP